ncbi:MAG: hypothetical protein V1681_05300 [Candidatus Neomarinimicrobiota bacterium]
MSSFIEDLVSAKYNRLNDWRTRYSKREYPDKIGMNLLYEGLTIEKDWDDLKKTFDTENQGSFDSFDEAYSFLYNKRRNIQINIVHPILEDSFKKVKKLPYLNFDTFRDMCYKAKDSNSDIVEEIEFTYFFHTSAYELIYGWSAFGLIGYDKNHAFQNISRTIFNGIDYYSLESLVQAFGQASSLFYKPLPR